MALNRSAVPPVRWVPGGHLVRDAFLDPAFDELHVDPSGVRAECAAALRSAVGAHAGDVALHRLVGELSVRSQAFRLLWAQAEVDFCRTGRKLFRHPVVGVVRLDYETLDVGGTGGLRLLIHSAEPGEIRRGVEGVMAGQRNLDGADVASEILHIVGRPAHVVINELQVRPLAHL
jgi:hypothetical protein